MGGGVLLGEKFNEMQPQLLKFPSVTQVSHNTGERGMGGVPSRHFLQARVCLSQWGPGSPACTQLHWPRGSLFVEEDWWLVLQ